jgi:Replication-relaxation
MSTTPAPSTTQHGTGAAPSRDRSAVPGVQRDTRAPRPSRTVPRVRASAEHTAALAGRLTARDRWLTRLLAEYRVLTSAQLAQAAFPSTHTANVRLRQLYHWRVINRFQPYSPRGTTRHHYVLDATGHAILAAEDGIGTAELRWHPEHAIAIAHSLQLAHTIAVNGFFTALIHAGRHPDNADDPADPGGTAGPAARLDAWWSEDRCGRLFGEHVRPDGYGRWTEPSPDGTGGADTVEFFLELDQSTESLARLAAKLGDYASLAAATGITTPLLFRFRTPAREAAARPALAAALTRLDQPATVPVATSAASTPAGTGPAAAAGPAGPVWLPVHPAGRPAPPTGNRRLRLAALAPAWQLAPPAGPATADDTAPPAARGGRTRLTPPPPMPPPTGQSERPW